MELTQLDYLKKQLGVNHLQISKRLNVTQQLTYMWKVNYKGKIPCKYHNIIFLWAKELKIKFDIKYFLGL